MKKKLFFLLLIPLFLLSQSCDRNKFNFDRLESIDAAGEWGFPLINAQYSVNDLIKQLNEDGYIVQTSDGNLAFVYESEEYLIGDASDFMTFPDYEDDFQYAVSNNLTYLQPIEFEIEETLDLQNEYVLLKRGEIKNGKITLRVNHNIHTTNLALKVILPEFKTPNNEIFSTDLNIDVHSGGVFTQEIDLTGLTFMPTAENQMSVKMSFQFVQMAEILQPEFNLDIKYSISNFTLNSFYGQVSEYSIPFSSMFDFDLFSTNYGGDITLYNPYLYISVKNSFYVTGELHIDTASFFSNTGEVSLLSSTPEVIAIPVSPLDFQDEAIENIDIVTLNTNYKSIKIAGDAILNPGGFGAGDIYVGNNSRIDGKFGLSIPFSFSMEEVFYTDTIKFSIDSISSLGKVEDILEEAAFRFAVTNGLPLNMNMQAYFYNSETQQLIDSMFTNSFYLPGVINGASPVQQIATPVITLERIDNIVSSDHIILRFKINTNGHQVDLNVRDNLKVKLGVKLRYDSTGVPLLSDSK